MLGCLSVVLPAFNEQENVPVVLGRCLEVLPRVAREWEVIVVDDGSSDDTFEVARAVVEEHHPQLRLIRHTRNQGYGAAIRTRFRAARRRASGRRPARR
jgi:glycosyltransferase involved in cell wall biosynthesis